MKPSMRAEKQQDVCNNDGLIVSHTCPGATGESGTGSGACEERQPFTVDDKGRALNEYLMERICESRNLNEAYKRVRANKGAAGVDQMKINDLREWLDKHKEEFIQSLLDGTYMPQPIRGVKIPKPSGGQRQLGIPTLRDRLVQQAFLQVLTSILDPMFSPSSFGFRPGRSAHDALRQAQRYVEDGRTIVVDCDLEKFFDRVNHDMLMARLARHVKDKRVLRIVRRFLEAGMMQDGICVRRNEGTPQGGPLSPLLANLLLDDLDKELEKRQHCFCRYADDCNIYVRTQIAGERVMESITQFLEKKLKLKVNREKSAVASIHQRKFLGYQLRAGG
jgi:RNA-directed DNA polymerase